MHHSLHFVDHIHLVYSVYSVTMFLLFYVLVFNFLVLLAPYVCYHIFSYVYVTEWPPIGKIAAHSAYEMLSWY